MLLPRDSAALERSGQKLLSVVGLSTLLGIVANVQIKRINMNFLKWPLIARLPVRLGVMALPFLPFYPTISEKANEITGIVNAINARKNQLIRTKDLEEYFEVEKSSPKQKTNPKKK